MLTPLFAVLQPALACRRSVCRLSQLSTQLQRRRSPRPSSQEKLRLSTRARLLPLFYHTILGIVPLTPALSPKPSKSRPGKPIFARASSGRPLPFSRRRGLGRWQGPSLQPSAPARLFRPPGALLPRFLRRRRSKASRLRACSQRRGRSRQAAEPLGFCSAPAEVQLSQSIGGPSHPQVPPRSALFLPPKGRPLQRVGRPWR
mmetsp:Transcript_46371/g.99324  ORF Transcript_46371/g.99324 Transcript_46371/m.99324 type:complete len:202 (+) Transcript_46371:1872-2477(+)